MSDLKYSTSLQSAWSSENASSIEQQISRFPSQTVPTKLDFNEALERVGGNGGRYQIRAFLYFGSQWFFGSWILLCSTFLLQPAQFESSFCDGLDDSDCKDKACKLDNPKQFMTNVDTTMVGTFNLICDDLIVSLIQSLVYVGSLVGFFLFAWIADNQGRRLAIMYSWIIATFGTILLAVSWNAYSATAAFIISGFGLNPAITVILSLLSEHSCGKFREYTTIGVQVLYGIGECAMVGVAFLFPNWRTFAWILAGAMIIINFGIFLIEESPKFMLERNMKEGLRILNKIAKVNKKDEIKEHEFEIEQSNSPQQQQESAKPAAAESSYTVLDLFKYKSLRKNTILMMLIFFAIQGVYYGCSFAMSKIGLDLYTNSIIIAVAETLAYTVTDHFIPHLKRKKTVFIGFGLCSILLLGFMFLSAPSGCDMCTQVILQIVFACIVRFMICFVWAVVYMQMTELFPTVIKSLALGVISSAGTVGSALAPYVGNISESLGISPMFSLGVLGVIGIISVLPIQETKGKPLEDQIEELKSEEQPLLKNADTTDGVFATATADYNTS